MTSRRDACDTTTACVLTRAQQGSNQKSRHTCHHPLEDAPPTPTTGPPPRTTAPRLIDGPPSTQHPDPTEGAHPMSEHTPSKITVTTADIRRAAALVVHHGRSDDEGMNAVLAEAIEAKRALNITLALLELNQEIVPLLYTRDGLSILSNHVTRIAGLEHDETTSDKRTNDEK